MTQRPGGFLRLTQRYVGRVARHRGFHARLLRGLTGLSWSARLCYLSAALADVTVTAWRWTVIARARNAGHADPSFYYDAARNVARGKGLTVDYVWQFLDLPPHLHHYAADYWQPLPSLLMATPMVLTGNHSVTTAASASVLAAALVPLSSGLLAYRLGCRHHAAALVAIAIAVLPRLSFWSVQTESVTFFMLFVVTAMAIASGPTSTRLKWFVTASFAAAAYLCRNDGVLVLAALALPVLRPLLTRGAVRAVRLARLELAAAYLLGAALVLTPWLTANFLSMHRLVPPTGQVAFLTSYEQLFSLGSHPTLSRMLSHGLGQALHFRWMTGKGLLTTVQTDLGRPIYWTLVACCAVNLAALRHRPPPTQPPGVARAAWPLLTGMAACAVLFQALVIPIAALGGTWDRSLMAYLPLLVIGALLGASRIPAGVFLVGATVILGFFLLHTAETPTQAIARNNAAGDLVGTYARFLPHPGSAAPVVMTRDPWQVNEVTGYPAVMIPDGDMCTVQTIAKRYAATVFVTAKQRPAFSDAVLRSHGFRFLGGTGLHDVYRFPARVPGC